MPKKLALIGWLVDGSFSVMPLSASKTKESELFVGSQTMMKWKGKKWYDVQILKISGKFCMFTKYAHKLTQFIICVITKIIHSLKL